MPYDNTQTFVQPGSPSRIVAYFDPNPVFPPGYMVYLYDGANNPIGKVGGYTGAALSNLTIAVQGDTIKVRLVADVDPPEYVYDVTKIRAANDGTVLACVHVYAGWWAYLSERDTDGIWSEGTIFAARSDSFTGVTTACMSNSYPDKLGAIGPTIWLGNGLPDAPTHMARDNGIGGDNVDPYWEGYWNASAGAWWINGAWYALLDIYNYNEGVNDSYRWVMLESIAYSGGDTDKPTLWTELDQGNSPSVTVRIGNTPRAAIRWDGTSMVVDMLARVEGTPNSNQLYAFNLTTKTWSAAYGVADFGAPISVGDDFVVGNGIFRYPNNDIGVVYAAGDTVYYRLYVSATSSWSSAVAVKTYAGHKALFCTMIPDPAKESLHVFTRDHDTGLGGDYHIVPHVAAPLPDLFAWATYSPDFFGNGTVFQGKLAIPFDVDENLVWVAPITGGATTFAAETVPRPAGEANTPSCATLFYIPTIPVELSGVSTGTSSATASLAVPLAGISAGTSIAGASLSAGGLPPPPAGPGGPGANNTMLVITV